MNYIKNKLTYHVRWFENSHLSARNQCEPKTICNLNGMKMEKTIQEWVNQC